ncbi:MAG: MMPL family transporter [Pseudomonadales bacterium]|nr:MMPL family transporter [Pseudomonadales bacterium]
MNSANNFFSRLGRVFITRPKTALVILAVIFAFMLMQLPKLRIDTSAESFLLPTSAPIVNYDKFRHEFGRDEFFIVIVTGVDVFSLDFLSTFRDFHHSLEADVANLQSVESLVNVRSIYGDGDDLIAEELLETFPENEADLQQIKQRIRGKEIYYDRLINRDEDTVAVLVKMMPTKRVVDEQGNEHFVNLGDSEIATGSAQIQAVADKFEQAFKGGEIYIGGSPAMGAYLSKVIQRDFGLFTGTALLMVAFVLMLLFKRASGVLIPITIMGIGIVCSMAMMPILDYPMQITTSILPTFLLAVCIGDSVHLLTIFYRKYDEGASKSDALLYALDHAGTAVFFTSLTTAAGLLTFSISEVQPVASLGLFAAIGSVVAFALTVTTIPTLITVLPIKRKPLVADAEKMQAGGLFYLFTKGCIYLSTQHPIKIVVLTTLFTVFAVMQVPNLRFSQDSLAWLPEDNAVKQAIFKVEEKITGTAPMEVIIDTGKTQGALDPVFLHKVDLWLASIAKKEMAGIKVVSINSLLGLIKETNQAFNGNNPEAYIIPDEQALIAQELLLIEMDEADDLYSYTDTDFSKLRITLIMPWNDAVIYKAYQEALLADYAKTFGPDSGYDMHLTGVTPIFSILLTAMIQSAAESYLIAAVVISLMMIILMRSVINGLLSMIPNLLPILAAVAFMVLVDMPMDVFTVLIGSIALGLCVDDTVHFMHGFNTAYKKHGDTVKAIEETLMTTGKALIITTIVLFCGFLTFMLSDLESMRNFSLLMVICIVLALLADFLVAPALMMLRYGSKKIADETLVENSLESLAETDAV